jgi:hypothetical protein
MTVSTSGAYSSFPTFLAYRIVADETAINEAANQSTVRVRAFIDCSTTFASSSGGSGTTPAGNWSRGSTNFSGPGSIEVFNTSFAVNHNADGSGSYTISGSSSMSGWGSASTGSATLTLTNFVRVPNAPASISVTTSTRTATVTSGVATVSGPAVTSYEVQRTPPDSTTFSGTISTMTSRQFTYTNLDGGKTYRFRVRARNSEGAGPWRESGNIFVPAGGKRWTGSAWTPTATAKRWNGSSWVDISTAKRWNGSAWIDLT